MNRMLIRGSGNYQAAGDVNVTNVFEQQGSHLAWIVAMGQATGNSIIVFDNELQVVFLNNAWHTFTDTRKIRGPKDIIKHAGHRYYNVHMAVETVEECARHMQPRNCCLHMVNGLDVVCRCQPVIHLGFLHGVILVAWTHDSNTKDVATSTLRIVE